MITFQPFEVSIAAAVILLILEIVFGTFMFLSFCIGCFAVATIEYFTGNVSLGRDLFVFTTTAASVASALRLGFRSPGDTKRARGDVNDY